MSKLARIRAAFALFAVLVCALAFAACGDDDSGGGSGDSTGSTGSTGGSSSGGKVIQANPDNANVTLTIGSKNFTEQIVLGEIYAQALAAAGYEVNKDLNLGSEVIALEAVKNGEVSGYPEYVSTALTSFFDVPPGAVPGDPQKGADQANAEFKKDGLVAFAPTPFASANAVGLLKSTAEDLGIHSISDLEGKSQDLTLFGSPECRQRVDCLVGLEDDYGLEFKSFTPVDIEQRYQVLDSGQADLSILFTTDAQLGTENSKYTILDDDKQVLPPGNVIFVTDQKTVDEAGPDYQATIELVQSELTNKVMQELSARVDLDQEDPAAVAADYLKAAGYIQ
jgi:glycine betaine/choline ABC-type transport system substrate-binding protein